MLKVVLNLGSCGTTRFRPVFANVRNHFWSDRHMRYYTTRQKNPLTTWFGYEEDIKTPRLSILRCEKIIEINECTIKHIKKAIFEAPKIYADKPATKDWIVRISQNEIAQRERCIQELHQKIDRLEAIQREEASLEMVGTDLPKE